MHHGWNVNGCAVCPEDRMYRADRNAPLAGLSTLKTDLTGQATEYRPGPPPGLGLGHGPVPPPPRPAP